MNFRGLPAPIAALALAVGVAAPPVRADEGMWTFDHFPGERVQAAYGVRVDAPWLARLQAASVRLTSGCSGSVVSPEGLVFTNQHCTVECLQAVSSARHDHLQEGFLTASRAEERKCPGMQAEILLSITDITADVAAATRDLTGIEFVIARESVMSAAERLACADDARLRCQTIPLFRGGQYKVYRYRTYDDVRLVFAPEFRAAFFGGDPDNFNFPRFNLDVAFLRLYEDGRPAVTPAFLRWNTQPPADGEFLMVSGNPGATERLLTVAQLESLRDISLPTAQLHRAELRGRLIQFAAASAEHRRVSQDSLFQVENAFKSNAGRLAALTDREVMDARRAAEAQLRSRVAADPALAASIGDPWGEIRAIQAHYAELFPAYRQLETSAGGGSDLFRFARTLVRGAQERGKPSGQRYAEYSDQRLALVEKNLLDEKPVDPVLERMLLEFWLLKTRELLGADDPAVRTLFGNETAEAIAARLIAGTRLADAGYRRSLWDGGFQAIVASEDPLIQFLLRLDPMARLVRRSWEDRVAAPTERAAERIARARFAVYGESVYPDATFSPRLSYGKVAGWSHRGTIVAPFTTIGGLFARATGADPYRLAPRWIAARDRLDPATVFNFATTHDIIGGNSGSPAVNAAGEVVGTAFDGNIHSLGGDYFYDGALNRTVVLSAGAVTEALIKVYERTALVRELGQNQVGRTTP